MALSARIVSSCEWSRYLAGKRFPSILAGREEEEVIDVGLAGFTPTVGQQRVGVLKDFSIELVDLNNVAILDKKSDVVSLLKKLKNRFRRPRAVSVFGFNKEDRPTSLEQP
ncbi:MAG: hypothetical protein ACRCV5_09400, partial [Afipia sp.]